MIDVDIDYGYDYPMQRYKIYKMDKESFYKHIGAAIRGARDALGMTQSELAHAVGLSRTSLTNIELGRQRILVDQLADLANELHVAVASLLPEQIEGPLQDDKLEGLESLPAVTNFLNAVRSFDNNA